MSPCAVCTPTATRFRLVFAKVITFPYTENMDIFEKTSGLPAVAQILALVAYHW
jgi:hypothetical protein